MASRRRVVSVKKAAMVKREDSDCVLKLETGNAERDCHIRVCFQSRTLYSIRVLSLSQNKISQSIRTAIMAMVKGKGEQRLCMNTQLSSMSDWG